jgi:RND family efflux transporter MFP subunit
VAKSALDKAAADLKAARQRYQATVARMKQAKEQLRYTVVKAPYTGVVVDRFVELGELVSPGKPVMSGLSLKELRAAAEIPQSLMAQMEATKKVRLFFSQASVDGQSQQKVVESRRIQLSPQADPKSHTFLARAYLPEDIPNVFPGMYVKMAIVTGEQKTLLVPEQAIVHRSELTAVYVVTDNKVHLRQVRIGSHEDGQVEILAGLDAGEQVALDPIQAGIYLKTRSPEGTTEPQHKKR